MWIVVFYWSGSEGLVWANGDRAKKAAFPAQALLLAPCLSHFHIRTSGLRLRGTCPRDRWFPLDYKLYVPRQDFQPQHMLAQTLQPPSPTPPHCYQSPRTAPDSFLQRVVLSVPCCYSNPKKICVSNSLKWRHLHAILKILVRVLVYCFDQLSLTCGQSLQRSSKGTDPSRQTSAFHTGVLPVDSCPPWNKSMKQSYERSEANSVPTSPAQPTTKCGQIKRLRLELPRSSFLQSRLCLNFHVNPWGPKILPLTHAPFEGWQRWCVVLDSSNPGFYFSFHLIMWPEVSEFHLGFSSLTCKASWLDVHGLFPV